MTPDEKSLLERTAALAQENNAILRSMRRTARFETIMRVIYWVIILGASYGAYVFVQPYVNTMLASVSQLQSTLKDAQGASQSVNQINSQLKNYLK